MATATLDGTPRSGVGTGDARKLRRQGIIPAVIYGHGREPQSLGVDGRTLERLLDRISYATTVIELSLDGRTARTLIREIQRHPFNRSILHVDFQELVAGEKITVRVPLVFVGSAAGVKEGGVLDQIMHEITIHVDPANMPNHIDVDVSPLTIGHSLHVGEIALPEGIEVLDDADAAVCTVTTPKTHAETAAPAEGEAVAEPEVIRAKKAEEEA